MARRLESGPNADNPPAVTSDGMPLKMYPNTEMTNPRGVRRLGQTHTYYGHLNRTTYDPTITPKHTLALFHYVTRSLEDYTSRKIALPSGIYTYNYVQYGQAHDRNLDDRAMMAHFEHSYGFDGNAPVCRSVRDSFYVARCCSALPNATGLQDRGKVQAALHAQHGAGAAQRRSDRGGGGRTRKPAGQLLV